MTRAATAQASSAANTRLTCAILATVRRGPGPTLNSLLRSSDTADVAAMTTSTSFLVPWAMVWVVLLRALLVEADLLPRT